MWCIIFLVATIFLAGCAESRYIKEGKTVRDAQQAYLACENQELIEHAGMRNLSDKEIQNLLDDCMKSKGYQVKQ